MTKQNNHIFGLYIAMSKQRMSIVVHVIVSGPFMQHKGMHAHDTSHCAWVAIFAQGQQLT